MLRGDVDAGRRGRRGGRSAAGEPRRGDVDLAAPIRLVSRGSSVWLVDVAGSGLGVADHATRGDPPVRVTVATLADGVVVRHGSEWTRTITGEADLPVVLAVAGDGVYVGVRTPRGARVVALGFDGAPRFDQAIVESSPRVIQLGVCEPFVCAYVRKDSDRETVQFDRRTGVARASTGAGCSAGRPRTARSGRRRRWRASRWGRPGTTGSAPTWCSRRVTGWWLSSAKTTWWCGAASWRGRWPFHDRAVVLESRTVAIVVYHSPICLGVTVWGLGLLARTQHWRRDPPGIGPVDHSEYENRVAAFIGPLQLLMVDGEESLGRYVAQLSADDGELYTDDIWRE